MGLDLPLLSVGRSVWVPNEEPGSAEFEMDLSLEEQLDLSLVTFNTLCG
jgi:hypothetical protein